MAASNSAPSPLAGEGWGEGDFDDEKTTMAASEITTELNKMAKRRAS
jgi:hypothetical protein